MPRSVDTWVGKTDDAMPPPRVRRRIFDAYAGVCQITGLTILSGDQWDLDHRIPLSMGGSNDERNLWPVLRYAHRVKSASEAASRSKANRVRNRHLGINGKKQALPGGKASRWKRKVNGTVERRDADHE